MVQPEVKVFTVLIADFIHKTFPPDLTRTYLVGEKVQEILKTVIVALSECGSILELLRREVQEF